MENNPRIKDPNLEQKTNAALVFFRGIPGSGKTTISLHLKERFLGDTCVILDPDQVDKDSHEFKEFSSYQRDLGVEEKFFVYRYLLDQAAKALEQGKTVIWNQPFTDLEGLAYTIRKLNRGVESELPVLVVDVSIPAEIAKSRVEDRKKKGGHGPTGGTFEKFVGRYTPANDLGYKVISLDGRHDPDSNASSIMEKIKEVYVS